MKATPRYLIPLAVAATLVALAGCSSIPVQTHHAAGTPTYPPTDPATVQILRQAPTQAHVKLGEITAEPQYSSTFVSEVESKLRDAGAKMGAHAVVLVVETVFTEAGTTLGWWHSADGPDLGQAFIGVPIRYTGQTAARALEAPQPNLSRRTDSGSKHVMINGQLELSFGANRQRQLHERRQRRMTRAQWWFERKREVIEQAIEPAPMVPPEQLWFGARRG